MSQRSARRDSTRMGNAAASRRRNWSIAANRLVPLRATSPRPINSDLELGAPVPVAIGQRSSPRSLPLSGAYGPGRLLDWDEILRRFACMPSRPCVSCAMMKPSDCRVGSRQRRQARLGSPSLTHASCPGRSGNLLGRGLRPIAHATFEQREWRKTPGCDGIVVSCTSCLTSTIKVALRPSNPNL